MKGFLHEPFCLLLICFWFVDTITLDDPKSQHGGIQPPVFWKTLDEDNNPTGGARTFRNLPGLLKVDCACLVGSPAVQGSSSCN